MKVRPDMTGITMSLEGMYPDYGETLRRSSQVTEQLNSPLAHPHISKTPSDHSSLP